MASQEDESHDLHSPKAIIRWKMGMVQAALTACTIPNPILEKAIPYVQ